MNKMTTTAFFYTVLILLTVQIVKSFDFLEPLIADPNKPLHIGSTLILRSISTSPYDRCSWKHHENTCHFDWNRHHNKLVNSRCGPYGDRMVFIGTYESHECKIEIKPIELSDSGIWTVEMRKGTGETIKRDISIQVVQPLQHPKNDSKRSSKDIENEPAFTKITKQGDSTLVTKKTIEPPTSTINNSLQSTAPNIITKALDDLDIDVDGIRI